MRPLRLEVEGFSAFRERVAVDFDGAELFALTGPTGSGKSSLIDAMIFALYGCVPRLEDRKVVHPVISQGRLQARVRLDFAVGGRSYTAVRVVQRARRGDSWGATTREARLESGAEVLAGSEKELTEAVERLLGLSFDQFTTCVVLPQGEFARFLRDKPASRQELLSKLLGLEAYRQMGTLARTRESAARTRLELGRDRLERLGEPTDKDRQEAERRVATMDKLLVRIEKARPGIEKLEVAVRETEQTVDRLEREAAALERVRVPPSVASLARDLREAREALEATSAGLRAADAALEKTRAARAALGDAAPLQAWVRAHGDREAETQRLTGGRAAAAAAADDALVSGKRLAEAERAVETARELGEGLHRQHAAHDLASKLGRGDPCPVCGQAVASLPKRKRPAALASADRALAAAERDCARAKEAERGAATAAAATEEAVRGGERQIAALDEALAGAPPAQEIAELLARIREAAQRVSAAEEACRAARDVEAKARAARERVETATAAAWRSFDAARDPVAGLEPPPADRDELERSWQALDVWARGLAGGRRGAAVAARAEAASLAERCAAERAALIEACLKAQLDPGGRAPRDAVTEALFHARSELQTIEGRLEEAERLRRETERARREADVARVLANHLRADGFERWVLDEAFERLLADASRVLFELSSGQYSFAHDERSNFEVVDHRNADERRSIRTLSGGETFLASLSLALTLVDQVAELAMGGSARLESIFLDEGFGSLDPETLDVVAGTIEELSTRGRVVGLVTHVRELADRIPVQYRVTKNAATSAVERVAL